MDASDYHADLSGPPDSYFFQQTTYRQTPRRFKKQPEELPQDLRFAHLNPRVAAYLQSKEKENDDDNPQFSRKSLLPQINETVNLIRHQLNSALSNDEDSQRFLFNEVKTNAPQVIVPLAKVLNYIRVSFQRINVPRSLECALLSTYSELTDDVHLIPREWQLPSNREEYLQKMIRDSENLRCDESRDGTTPMGSMLSLGGTGSRAGDQDDVRSVRSVKSNRSAKETVDAPTAVKVNKSQSRAKPTSRTSLLADIAEHDEGRDGRNASKADHVGNGAGKSRERLNIRGPKTRLEKFRPTSLEPSSRLEGRPSTLNTRKASRLAPDDASEAGSATESVKSMVDKTGYWAVIQFQLSSKACEDKGWIVQPDSEKDPERETLYEWATQQLQPMIKQKSDEDDERRQLGLDKPIVLRYYGDSRREVMQKYGRCRPTGSRSAPALSRGLLPRVPLLHTPDDSGRQLFMSTLPDGSMTLFYPSGNAAILSSSAGPGRQGFYTLVYDDLPGNRMLAAFTPTGRGCCYHENGNIHFLATEKGGTVADELGCVTKRWSWPAPTGKLAVSIAIEITPFIAFRCVGQTQMHIYFSCHKESQRVSVGLTPGAEEPKPKDEGNLLISGMPFSSQAAKDALRPYKPKPAISKEKKIKSGKKLAILLSMASKTAKQGASSGLPTALLNPDTSHNNNTLRPPSPRFRPVSPTQDKNKLSQQAPEIQKLMEMPEQRADNDADADKELLKLQRKVRNLVEDWLEHYRLAVGIASPHLRSVQDVPRVRQSQSAKSSPAGAHVVVESLATQVVRPHVEPRAPSAPPGRFMDRPGSERGSRIDSRPASVAKDVKFEEYQTEIPEDEDDAESLVRSTAFPSSLESGSTARPRSTRAKSAPLRMCVDRTNHIAGTPLVACPVALRQAMLGETNVACKCSRHKIPLISDIELDEFIHRHAMPDQLIVIATISSLYPTSLKCTTMLEQLYSERNRNRTRPCLQARTDNFRVFLYDTATASDFTDHTTPLLLRRHNVVPAMFLMYENGQLLFCDHIFNGYGNARKDFHKQMLQSRRSSSMGRTLPQDFRFSPLHGRHGPRSPWGGEIGGAGVDHHGNAGITMESRYVVRKGKSCASITSSDDSIMNSELAFDGAASAAKYISMRLTFKTGPHGAYDSASVSSCTDLHADYTVEKTDNTVHYPRSISAGPRMGMHIAQTIPV